MSSKAQTGKAKVSNLNKRFYQAMAVIGAPAIPVVYGFALLKNWINRREIQAAKERFAALDAAENSPEARAAEMAQVREEQKLGKKIDISMSRMKELTAFLTDQDKAPSNHGDVHKGASKVETLEAK